MSKRPCLSIIFRLSFIMFAMLTAPVAADQITLRHVFGETTVNPEKLKRIVSVGYHEQDFLYALGLAPVGVHEWFGDYPYATWPWAEIVRTALAATPDVQKGMEIDVEWVWSMKPDLIVATFAPLDPRIYAQLSEIAPVIGPPENFPRWGAPWEEELKLIAQATGREENAARIIAQLKTRIDVAAKAHPEFQNHSGTAAFFSEGLIVGYPRSDGANRLLDALGIRTPERFDELSGTNGRFSVSPERLDIFDLDVVLWQVDTPSQDTIKALPTWNATRMAREGRAIWADEVLTGAMSFQSPLSIGWAMDQMIPMLEIALDGNPATTNKSLD